MCGIAGICCRNGHSQDRVTAAMGLMLAALRHRGPNDCGIQAIGHASNSPIYLANTRLSILDLSSAGHQPMVDPATGNWIVLNGEIYNHRELRLELSSTFGQWRSTSDTETVLRAYARWGPACAARLRGMFAVAIYDHARRLLWCARDRFGIKPFYYWTGPTGFAFASEVRALLRSGLFSPTPCAAGLSSFLRFGSVSEPHTLVQEIRSLPPAHWLEVSDGQLLSCERYWNLEAPCDESASADLAGQLERSVGEHLLADVPVGCFLSGGLDSSIITALAARQSRRPLNTFTVAFADELDESRHARAVADRYATHHREVRLSSEDVSALVPAAVAAMDQPSADGVNTYVVSKAVAESGVKVVLSGLGGDELYGGYPSFQLLPLAHNWSWLLGRLPAALRNRLRGGQRTVEATSSDASFPERYFALRSFWSSAELKKLGVEVRHLVEAAHNAGIGNHDFAALPLATQVSVLELTHYMRNVLLRDGDAMTMSHSLEMRVPFLDHLLAADCIRSGVAGRGTKTALVRLAGTLLPASVIHRPKQGFVLPMGQWMRGSLRSFVQSGLRHLHSARLLPPANLQHLAARFEAGRLPWARLWQMAVLGHWVANNIGAGEWSSHSPPVSTPIGVM